MKPEDKPQNGLAGLKYWRYDLFAGLQVALVSLPLSLGIAVASGAPPVTGLVSSIIAGLIFPFLGGAYATISGPAAGLAPALLAGMLLLGNGDLAAGYPLMLVAIFFTGVVMILLSWLRAGKLVAMFLPVTVVEAMLAAIGLMIIIKQVPSLLGDLAPPEKSMLIAIAKLPESFQRIEPSIFLIGAVCLFLMFFLSRTRLAWLRRVPPALSVCAIGVVLGYVFNLAPQHLISMPDSILEGGFTLPAFDAVLARPELWGSVVLMVITLTLIDSIESLATISAVDKIDPYRRKSRPNVTLRAMGISNVLSSLAGGLTIIPGGVKSRANIDAGGRTLWANFYNAMFLIVFLFFAVELIGRIPLAAIGAVIVYVGWRLCEIKVFSKTAAIGLDQLAIFIVTIAAILMTDLLVGILIGVAAQLLMNTYLLTPSLRMVLEGRISFRQFLAAIASAVCGMFCSPVIRVKEESANGRPQTQLSLGSLTGFNLMPLDRALARVSDTAGVSLALNESSHIIDRTTLEYLHELQEEHVHRDRPLEIHGLERFHPFTSHPFATRMQDQRFVHEPATHTAREQDMATLAQRLGLKFAPAVAAVLNRHDFVYLRRGANRQEWNVMTGTHGDHHVKLFDYSHTAAPEYYVEHRHTLAILRRCDEATAALPNLALTPGDYLERYLVADYRELEIAGLDAEFAKRYRVYGENTADVQACLNAALVGYMLAYPGTYVEFRDGVLLVFRPERGLESPDATENLLAHAEKIMAWLARSPGESQHTPKP
ncbi:MAG: SulP family inorganic anion transporter [Gammaproteobacteria bacterium]